LTGEAAGGAWEYRISIYTQCGESEQDAAGLFTAVFWAFHGKKADVDGT
jgi:hypothetical protein